MSIEFKKVNEQGRTYIYIRDGALHGITFDGVVEVGISASGGHRLNLKDGGKAIPAKDWIAIEIDVEEWTF